MDTFLNKLLCPEKKKLLSQIAAGTNIAKLFGRKKHRELQP